MSDFSKILSDKLFTKFINWDKLVISLYDYSTYKFALSDILRTILSIEETISETVKFNIQNQGK